MARTSVPLSTPVGPYPALPVTALSADATMQALTGSSGSNGNQAAFGNFNRIMAVVWNSDVSGHTFTATSVASANIFNRTGDISAYAIAAGVFSVFFFERNGWAQSDGNLYFEANSNTVKAALFGIQ